MHLYRSIDVWKPADETGAVRYRCFEVPQNGCEGVQSSDVSTLPGGEPLVRSLEAPFLELLMEQRPEERDAAFTSLAEAVARRDRTFPGSTTAAWKGTSK